ncbi:uncharacterized protein LOC134286390 [Aedes albopictus]|uniref:ribonuclease H n=1 Tax=Aedes albopictus TaxID=7160 RepID=A0ABM1ZAF5_AEDAL
MQTFDRVEMDRIVKTTLVEARPKKERTPPSVWQKLFKEATHTMYKEYSKIFTDGSKTSSGTALAVYDETDSTNIAESINTNFSITNAELLAILRAIELVKLKGYKKSIIFTDSKSACEMLLNLRTIKDNYLLGEIYKELQSMAGSVCKIQWIPSHTGIHGNETADQLAVSKTREKQTCCRGITAGDALNLSKLETWEEWRQKYKNISKDKGIWHFQLMERPGQKIWSKDLILNPDEVKTLNRIRSGHCLTKDRKANWGWEDDNLCEWCEVTENLKHILYDCPRYNQSRSQFPPLEYMKPLEMILQEGCEEELKQIVKFLKANEVHI